MGGVLTVALGIVLGGVMLALLALAVIYRRLTLWLLATAVVVIVGLAVVVAAGLGYWHSRAGGWDALAVAGVAPAALVFVGLVVWAYITDYRERKAAAIAAGRVVSPGALVWEVLTSTTEKATSDADDGSKDADDGSKDADDGSEDADDGSEDGSEDPVLDIHSATKALARELADVADEEFKSGGERAAQIDRLAVVSEVLLLGWLVRNGLVGSENKKRVSFVLDLSAACQTLEEAETLARLLVQSGWAWRCLAENVPRPMPGGDSCRAVNDIGADTCSECGAARPKGEEA